MPRLGVLGWPVAHSRSPAIHNAALDALGMRDWNYQRLPVPPQLFEQTVRSLHGSGFAGANATISHKRSALLLADRVSDTAREIGAANTLSFTADGTISADNTDGPGLVAAMGPAPRGATALVLGAGGSARAAVWALHRAGARAVAIWNRTPERARELADEMGARAVDRPENADLLINCTSVGMGLQRSATDDEALNKVGLTFDQVGEYSYVVDLVYLPGSTPLLAAAAAHGSRTLDGLEVLIAQGALSFELWTGVSPPLDAMRRAALDGRQGE